MFTALARWRRHRGNKKTFAMQNIPISRLVENQTTNGLYLVDSRFEELLQSIEVFGVLEPLIVFEIEAPEETYQVVSGNRRLRAARELVHESVPCIIIDQVDITDELVSAHQEQRLKKPSDIIRELRILKDVYGLRQGVRGSTNQELQKAKDYKAKLIEQYNVSAINKLGQYDAKVRELVGDNEGDYRKHMAEIDKSGNISGSLKRVVRLLDERKNRLKIPTNYEVKVGSCRIIPKSSHDLSDLENESVQMGICSPPYFDMRDYGNGKGEFGQEETFTMFVDKLVVHFSDFKRVLKPNGTLWVNLGDYLIGGGYELVPERFAISMINNGWMLHDRIIWSKKNPTWSDSNRSVMSTESIFIFKKSYSPLYNLAWLKEMGVINDYVTIGKANGIVKLRSFFDFRDDVLITSIPNNSTLRTACAAQGITLTHSATFPISLPLIAIMTGSQEGDLIVDHFSGTATTGKACQILGRSYVGYELNPTYMRMGEIRLNMPLEEVAETDFDMQELKLAA
jgi:ParB/RepB/Spo0J family partition protein